MRIHKGHEPTLGPTGTDLLVTVLSDGSVTLAYRAGNDDMRAMWSTAITLEAQQLGMPEAAR